jgi:hypothetical protein
MASISDQMNESLRQLVKEEEEEELDELDYDDDIGEGKEVEEAALDEEEGVAGVGSRFDMEFSEDPPGHKAGERCRGRGGGLGRGAHGIHTKQHCSLPLHMVCGARSNSQVFMPVPLLAIMCSCMPAHLLTPLAPHPSPHAGFVAIIGRPNAGKSTLLNALLGQQLSIVTQKAQTTRHRVLGILSEPDHQIIFLDTPGILQVGVAAAGAHSMVASVAEIHGRNWVQKHLLILHEHIASAQYGGLATPLIPLIRAVTPLATPLIPLIRTVTPLPRFCRANATSWRSA